ncbi:penicillin-binding protein activator [Metallibacterium sp.]|jgi:hypothetical protein|uniref:penicillin-binding protein activator n=1 Tax=Metallibacterium sp. TaxID=2940281 RepID=UPI00263769C6|nr:penicillin-binding protein activator [Metallibacterium sp.]
MMRSSSILLLALLPLLLAGCATLGGPTPAQQAANAQADALYQRGDYQGAARTWDNLSAQSPRSNQGNDYRLRAADAWYVAGQHARAAQLLATVDGAHLHALDAARYNLLKGELALTHDPQQALAIAAMLPSTLPPTLALRAARLQAEAAGALGDHWASARARVRMDNLLSGKARQRNARDIERMLVALGVPALQKQASKLPAGDPMLPWLGRALHRLGSALPKNLPQLMQPAGTVITQGGGSTQEGFHAYRQIALLLPLSGPLKVAGDAVAEGFLTAYFNTAQAQPRPLLRVYDTQGTPAGALAAYQLAQSDGADLVVGPLARDAVAALFDSNPSLPVLALNHPDSTVNPPRGSAEFGLMPANDGTQAAARMLQQGIHSAVVFIAGSDNEQRAAQAFKAQFEAGGGDVLTVQTLPQGTVNYANEIRNAMPGLGANGGIFIAVPPETARLLMPQIRVARLRQPVFASVQVYGGSPNALDKDLDGVQFPDAPWLYDAQPGLPVRASLMRDLPVVAGRGARLFAFGMDADLLSPYFVWLQQHPGSYVAGATGQLSVDAQGHVQRTPIWVQFNNGVATPMAGTLNLSAPTQ